MNAFIRKFLLCLFLEAGVLAIPIQQISAQTPTPTSNSPEFQTRIETTYTVSADGPTSVKHQFTLTNQTPSVYIQRYALKLGYPDLQNVTATNEGQTIQPNVTTEDTATTIEIQFPNQVVGQGKRRSFTVEYQSSSLATVGGRVLELNVPKLAEPSTAHKIKLITPSKFGAPVRVSPKPSFMYNDGTIVTTEFEQIGNEPVSALFGEEQVFSVTLRYHLQNQSSSTALAQIALPPDTLFQRVNYRSLDPPPQSMKRDEDGNWIATYEVGGQSAVTPQLAADILVSLKPNSDIPYAKPGETYIKQLEFWERDDKKILDIASQFTTPEAIFNHVIDTLSYTTQPLENSRERLGAVKAFEHPDNAVCQEFTDAFIALARANNIPARQLVGYAYSQNRDLRPVSIEGDILHAWPEYFDEGAGQWRQVDPTWEDTTGGVDYFSQFDLNHIVFAINGISSTLPHPAGSYKTNAISKDVEVAFSDTFPPVSPQAKVAFIPTKVLGISIPGMYMLTVSNLTGQAWYNVYTKLQVSEDVSITAKQLDQPLTLLPFQTVSLPVALNTDVWYRQSETPLTVTLQLPNNVPVAHDQTTYNLTAGSQIFQVFNHPQLIAGVGIGAALLALAAGSLLVFRPKKRSSLRR